MTYILLVLFLAGMVLGAVSVASSPSPYFGAFGLVGMAVAGCSVLGANGASFLSLVLLLIYLGGMLVVFAYSAALAAEPYPEAWGEWSVLGAAVAYLVVVTGAVIWFSSPEDGVKWLLGGEGSLAVIGMDSGGVGMMYSSGGILLGVCAWVLFLTLFVVMCVSWGRAQGAIRKV
uniref:NADH dehydrogenase subunit 6 n=1 Tax=Bregmaceros mcclellandi TaxID=2831535 RepID=UPI001EDF0F8D|nr:NADH dehydrogenase subunit 6 [Bregmaceros mcclellandi]UIX24725.1 NADH dehydrogenase subunit 6 [Bregmaceros mcclellandi]